jgi:hypothetical protein
MAQRYQFMNYMDKSVDVQVVTEDTIELYKLADSTPPDNPGELQANRGAGQFVIAVPAGTIFGFFTEKVATVTDPKLPGFVIRVADGKVPWPDPPLVKPSSLAHVADFDQRYRRFLEPAGGVVLRKVRAILIAGDQPGVPGTATPNANEALDILETDLNRRFQGGSVAIERLGTRSTKDLIDDVFRKMVPIVNDGDLFVVMFAGHGQEAAGDTHAQAWMLSGNQVYTDKDLAAALGLFPKALDTVVISDCCFGQGMLRVGDSDLDESDQEDIELQRQSKILPDLLPRQCDQPMVCISAASPQAHVMLTNLDDLAREIVRAAARQQSYRQLSDHFQKTKVAGRAFHVDARPVKRLGDLVLSTSMPADRMAQSVPQLAPISSADQRGDTIGTQELLDLLTPLWERLSRALAASAAPVAPGPPATLAAPPQGSSGSLPGTIYKADRPAGGTPRNGSR